MFAPSRACSPRCEDGSKPITGELPTTPARSVQASLVSGGYAQLECVLDRIVGDLGNNVLIIGRIQAARVDQGAMRLSDQDDQDLLYHAPLLAYLYPDRFAEISETNKLPFPSGFKR